MRATLLRGNLNNPIFVLLVVSKAEKLVGLTLSTLMIMSEILTGQNFVLDTLRLECSVKFLGTLFACTIFFSDVAVSVMRLAYVQKSGFILQVGSCMEFAVTR